MFRVVWILIIKDVIITTCCDGHAPTCSSLPGHAACACLPLQLRLLLECVELILALHVRAGSQRVGSKQCCNGSAGCRSCKLQLSWQKTP